MTAKSEALQYTVTETINASTSTTLGALGVKAGAVKVGDKAVNLTTSMTVQDFINAVGGGVVTFDAESAQLNIAADVTDTGSTGIISALGLEKTVKDTYISSSSLKYNETVVSDATGATKLSEFGITNSLSAANRTVKVFNADGNLLKS